MSNDFNITGPQKKPHPMRCWYCQRTSPKEMTEQMSTFGPDRYIPKVDGKLLVIQLFQKPVIIRNFIDIKFGLVCTL